MLESLRLSGHYKVKSITETQVLEITNLDHKIDTVQESNKASFSDEALMIAYAKGNVQAFEQLYGRHKDPLLRYFIRQVSQRATAEELFQETWKSLITNSATYKSTAKFTTYLYRIAHSRLVDFYRKNGRVDWSSLDDEAQNFVIQADSENEPDRQLGLGQLQQKMLVVLEQLPAAQKEVFILKFETGMSIAEIAESLGENPEAIKSRLRYCVNNLKGYINPKELTS